MVSPNQRRNGRVAFGQPFSAVITAVDGQWRRECAVENVSQTGAKLVLKNDVAGLDLAEFILLLSPSGSVFRRCQLARHHGLELGVRFIGGSNT